MRIFFLIFAMLALMSCAGPNPNPGERTVDKAWERYDYTTAFEILEPAAIRGEPWAQLRMGVAYELGSGVEADVPTAIKWYELASAQEADGNWANGLLIGGFGRLGYFNQTGDSLIAKHQLSIIYFRGNGVPRDLKKAFELAQHVSKKTAGKNLFYCCEFSGGRYITSTVIADTLRKIETARE